MRMTANLFITKQYLRKKLEPILYTTEELATRRTAKNDA